MTFNSKCPTCETTINICGFSVRGCEMPLRENGWAIMATPKLTKGTEYFDCPRCQVTVPCDWVYKEMSQKAAQDLMKTWGANPYSIHNRKPVPKDAPVEQPEPEEPVAEAS